MQEVRPDYRNRYYGQKGPLREFLLHLRTYKYIALTVLFFFCNCLQKTAAAIEVHCLYQGKQLPSQITRETKKTHMCTHALVQSENTHLALVQDDLNLLFLSMIQPLIQPQLNLFHSPWVQDLC